MSDPRKYRTKDEERQEEANDCIEHLTQYLCDEHDLATEAIKQMSRQVKAQVKLAVQWANQSPEPPIEELYTDVYTDHWGPYTGTSKPEMLRPEDKS